MSGDTSPSDDLRPSGAEAPVDERPPAAEPAPADPPVAVADPSEGHVEESQSARVSELEAKLEALQADHDSLRSQYMRIAADFDNFRKRVSRDREDLRLQITSTTLSEILPVVDNFDRARQQLEPQSEEAQNLHRSYQGLYKQLVEVFKQLGVAPMRVQGEPFDPSLHEAVMRETSHDHPEDVVIEELQRGYHIHDRVLRHALVKVSMGPGPGASSQPGQSGDSGEGGAAPGDEERHG